MIPHSIIDRLDTDSIDSLRHPGIKPDLLGLLCRLRPFLFRFSCIHGRIGLATGRSSAPDPGGHARNRVGTRHLLCRCNDRVFQIRLYRPHHLFNLHFALFDCGSVAFGEASLTLVMRLLDNLSRISTFVKPTSVARNLNSVGRRY